MHFNFFFFWGGGGRVGGGGGRLFEAGRLLTFSAFMVGAYSRWAIIRCWALNRINIEIQARVRIPLRPRKSFFRATSQLNCDHNCEGHLPFNCIPAVHITSLSTCQEDLSQRKRKQLTFIYSPLGRTAYWHLKGLCHGFLASL